MPDYFELLTKRRSIRDFEDKDVSLDIINESIKESCMAPSSRNGQPWRFIIVNDKALIKSLSDESKKKYYPISRKTLILPLKIRD